MALVAVPRDDDWPPVHEGMTCREMDQFADQLDARLKDLHRECARAEGTRDLALHLLRELARRRACTPEWLARVQQFVNEQDGVVPF